MSASSLACVGIAMVGCCAVAWLAAWLPRPRGEASRTENMPPDFEERKNASDVDKGSLE